MPATNNPQLQALIKRFETVYEGQPWYGSSMLSSLKKIAPELITRSLIPGKKNIAELVRHIVAWRLFLIEHLKGNHSYQIDLDTELDWPPVQGLGWEELLEELAESQQTIIELLGGQEDAILKKIMSHGKNEYSFRYLIEGVIQHDIYHLGQINLIRVLLEAQPSSQ